MNLRRIPMPLVLAADQGVITTQQAIELTMLIEDCGCGMATCPDFEFGPIPEHLMDAAGNVMLLELPGPSALVH